MSSPLGKYAPLAAFIACIGAIVAYLLSVIFGHLLQLTESDISNLKDLAILAFGVVSGTALGVNGWKREVAAIHTRLDQVAPPAANIDVKEITP